MSEISMIDVSKAMEDAIIMIASDVTPGWSKRLEYRVAHETYRLVLNEELLMLTSNADTAVREYNRL